jgi:AbrB family looped-hinge helix DNA binding protein
MAATRTLKHPSVSSVTSKGQVTIPAHIRRVLGVGPHDRVEFRVNDGRVEISRAESIVERTKGILRTNMPYLTPREEKVLFEEAMAEDAMKPAR